MSGPPASFTGKILLSVKMEVDADKADIVQSYLIALRDHANTDAEPGTLMYRVSRCGSTFGLFEEYESIAAHSAHQTHLPWLEFVKHALPLIKVTVDFYEEV